MKGLQNPDSTDYIDHSLDEKFCNIGHGDQTKKFRGPAVSVSEDNEGLGPNFPVRFSEVVDFLNAAFETRPPQQKPDVMYDLHENAASVLTALVESEGYQQHDW